MNMSDRKKRHKVEAAEDTPTTSSGSGSGSERRRRHRHRHRHRDRDRDRERREREEKIRRRKRREGRKRKRRGEYDSEEEESVRVPPHTVVRQMMAQFPHVANDLKQLLQMIDDGQAVDIRGISETLLVKHLKKLFLSLHLEENGDGLFLLPSKVPPTLELVGPLILSYVASGKEHVDSPPAVSETHSFPTHVPSPPPPPQRR